MLRILFLRILLPIGLVLLLYFVSRRISQRPPSSKKPSYSGRRESAKYDKEEWERIKKKLEE